MKYFCLFLLSSMVIAQSSIPTESQFYPANIFKLDRKFLHHVIVVEKYTHKLHVYENNNGNPELVRTFKVATGKRRGNKSIRGDKKTPEGIYTLQNFLSGQSLVKKYGKEGLIYGAGSFPTNYPNILDRRSGKTGGGIWLHSTNNDKRVDKGLDSKGCVVATDFDIREIAKYIDVTNTAIIITEQMPFNSAATWNYQRSEILNIVQTWANSWKNKDFDKYIVNYSQTEFSHHRKGSFSKYKKYKKAVFARKDKPEITFENISILKIKDYALVQMQQNYESDIISDSGKKTLYLKRDSNYQWKIVAEIWSKLDKDNRLSFIPQQRYFKE
jgi:murein L,D-transpeptidase YafK